MRKKDYMALIADMSSVWSNGDGAVMVLSRPSAKDTRQLRLCVWQAKDDLVPGPCIVWSDEKRVYEGGLGSDGLLALLTKHKACLGICGTFRGAVGVPKCYGNMLKCRNASCPARRKC